MASIVTYAQTARDSYDDRPLGQADQLCLACLAYLRYPDWLGVDNRAGMRLADLADERFVPLLTQGLHDPVHSAELVRALGESPRFGNVRACLHAGVPEAAWVCLTVLLVGAMVLGCLGIAGAYLARMYDEVKGRALYIVSERV